MKILIFSIFLSVMLDGGPVYKEFIEDAFVKEPWNAFSSLVFFIPVFYWAIKLRTEAKRRIFLYILLFFLFLNGLGSILYHAFRSEPIFLYLDFVPAIFMTVSLGLFFWNKIFNSWGYSIFILLILNSFRIILFSIPLKDQTFLNLNYLITGLSIILPALIVLMKTNFRYALYFVLAAVFITASLIFRVIDKWDVFGFPMGTHFLWHIFSVLAIFPLFSYIYKIQFHPLKSLNYRKHKVD